MKTEQKELVTSQGGVRLAELVYVLAGRRTGDGLKLSVLRK